MTLSAVDVCLARLPGMPICLPVVVVAAAAACSSVSWGRVAMVSGLLRLAGWTQRAV